MYKSEPQSPYLSILHSLVVKCCYNERLSRDSLTYGLYLCMYNVSPKHDKANYLRRMGKVARLSVC